MSLSMFDQFPRGIVCRRAVRLAADADAVWGVIGDVGSIEIAKDFIERIELRGSGAGAIRTLYLRNGARIRERIEEYSNDDRYYVYRVLDPGALDFTHYFATASVQPAGAGQSILMWLTTATAVDGKEEEMRALLDGNILMVFAGIKRALGLH